MNNLVKFLILSFLILWPASLNADSKPSTYIKCGNLERDRGQLATRKRELIVELDLVNKYYFTLQWVDGPKNIGHFWGGAGFLSLLGNNDEFYVFEDLWLWEDAESEEKLIKDLKSYSLKNLDEDGGNQLIKLFKQLPPLQRMHSFGMNVRLNRETLTLTGSNGGIAKDYKCELIDQQTHTGTVYMIQVLFRDKYAEAFERAEELKSKEQIEKEEQRERFKL
tara:strand:+ start:74 stop:739 length:666 start_codon:yes stop_codon:yes gene_type:complete